MHLLAAVSWSKQTGFVFTPGLQSELAGNEWQPGVGQISAWSRATPLLPSRPPNPASTLRARAPRRTRELAGVTGEGKGSNARRGASPTPGPKELGNMTAIAMGLLETRTIPRWAQYPASRSPGRSKKGLTDLTLGGVKWKPEDAEA